MGEVEWENIYYDNQGVDLAGEAIALSNDGGAVIAVDNGSYGFLKISPF